MRSAVYVVTMTPVIHGEDGNIGERAQIDKILNFERYPNKNHFSHEHLEAFYTHIYESPHEKFQCSIFPYAI